MSRVIFGSPDGFDASYIYEYVDALSAGPVRIPNGDFLLSADYGRMGTDLSLSEGGSTVVVKNFFTLQQAPDLMTEDGHSVIEGSLAVKLAFTLAEELAGLETLYFHRSFHHDGCIIFHNGSICIVRVILGWGRGWC